MVYSEVAVGQDSSQQAVRFRDQILVGARFSSPIQAGPGAHPAPHTMGSFPGTQQLGHGIDHPSPSSPEVKERVQLYIYSPSGPSWPVLG